MNARRRTVLTTGAASAAALVTGCGSSGGEDGGDSRTPTASGRATSAGPGVSSDGGKELARTADIPVGGGTVLQDRKVVVTQPAAGEFKAFSAVCTHAGCIVSSVADGTIDCACHGSRFSITDAAVEAGPAPRPLPEEKITVSGGIIRLA
ncbi:Rieske (2Fe-2S) protein [Streptomyces sp. NBC_01433]|uniref:Rieske (2Fe-2S) protein n=1 Tax=Streptomyces sp. NBC_01433 TaxID=2903864 RepID=UPI00224F0D20|nr:Rieske (2Fe-2S) protein [Streptomyces sp. NBC_01433]MCX4678238.1 Rieske (2Fe-2S) protein [Streptomyces sp. NBC_01433]